MFSLIRTILVGAFIGWLAGKLMKTEGGWLFNIVVGIVGSFIGSILCSLIGIYAYGWIFGFVVDILGACILLWLLNWIRGRRS